MKFLSVCISKLRKLVGVSMVRSSTIESLLGILRSSDQRAGETSLELHQLRQEVQEVREQYLQKETELAQLRHTLDLKDFEIESLQSQPPATVWVMAPEVYKKFCLEFEQPIVNGNSSDHEAAYKLGIQRVLSRIGERYVSR